MAQTKSGRNVKWFFNGQAVGMGRMLHLKPDTTVGLEAVKEVGRPDVVEYVEKIEETTVALGYNVIHKGALALAMGQTLGQLNNGKGHVPRLPSGFDVVEKRIKPGTEGTFPINGVGGETYDGFTVYPVCSVEKHSYEQEVDKIFGRSISVKCETPLDFEGINGIQFDNLTGNGVLTAFTLTKYSIGLSTGALMIRVETPYKTVLREGSDYTVASTSSTTTITFGTAPASSAVPNILALYPW